MRADLGAGNHGMGKLNTCWEKQNSPSNYYPSATTRLALLIEVTPYLLFACSSKEGGGDGGGGLITPPPTQPARFELSCVSVHDRDQ